MRRYFSLFIVFALLVTLFIVFTTRESSNSISFIKDESILPSSDGRLGVNYFECWRQQLSEDSIARPDARSQKVVERVMIEKNGSISGSISNVPITSFSDTECSSQIGAPAFASGDINNDGILDIVKAPNIVWLSKSNGGYEIDYLPIPATSNNPASRDQKMSTSQWSSVPVIADLANDGIQRVMVYSTSSSYPYLFNTYEWRAGSWLDVSSLWSLKKSNGSQWVSMIVPFDYDNDGWLDLAVGKSYWLNSFAFSVQQGNTDAGVIILRNTTGEGRVGFVDLTAELKIAQAVTEAEHIDAYFNGFGPYGKPILRVNGLLSADLDNDSWTDLLVAGDLGTGLILWNNKGNSFSFDKNTAINGSSLMGIAIDDINDDGFSDIFISQIHNPKNVWYGCPMARICDVDKVGNVFYLSDGPRNYVESAEKLGLLKGGWGWGATFVDLDNDGRVELVQAAGQQSVSPADGWVHRNDPVKIWTRTGSKDGKWLDVSDKSGIDVGAPSAGILTLDVDNDGDQDLLVSSPYYREPLIYINQQQREGNIIRVLPEGRSRKNLPGSNRDGVGAIVKVESENGRWWAIAGTQHQSYLTSDNSTVTFSVIKSKRYKVTVTFPATGKMVVLDGVLPNNDILIVKEPN